MWLLKDFVVYGIHKRKRSEIFRKWCKWQNHSICSGKADDGVQCGNNNSEKGKCVKSQEKQNFCRQGLFFVDIKWTVFQNELFKKKNAFTWRLHTSRENKDIRISRNKTSVGRQKKMELAFSDRHEVRWNVQKGSYQASDLGTDFGN